LNLKALVLLQAVEEPASWALQLIPLFILSE